MQRPALAAALCILATGPLHALSCLPASLARSYEQAADAEASYVVVLGTVDMQAEVPERPVENDAKDLALPGRLTGMTLSRRGFETPVSRDVTVLSACSGPWCGQFPVESSEAVMFVRLSEVGDWVLEMNACPTWHFPEPNEADIDALVQCHLDGGCAE